MKKLLFAFMTALVFLGCGPNQPDNGILNTRETLVGYQPTTPDRDPDPVYQKEVQLRPSWGQANEWASQRGDYNIFQILGVVLVLAAGWLLCGFYSLLNWAIFKRFPNMSSMAFGVFMFVALAGALVSFKWQAASIKWNNDIWVPAAQYDNAMKTAGSTAPIWDDLVKNCRITWGPYNCYK